MTEQVFQAVRDGDMVITMGAGDIYKAGELLLEKLAAGGSERKRKSQ